MIRYLPKLLRYLFKIFGEQVRGRLYELISHCIPPDVIFVGLLKELIKNCDGHLKNEVGIYI